MIRRNMRPIAGQLCLAHKIGTVYRALLPAGLVLALVTFVPPRSTEAGTASTTFQVTANIGTNCLISATSLAFGQYQPATVHATTPLNGQSEIIVTCTNTGTFTIGLDQGTFNGATTTTRRLRGPTNSFLNYSLFSDAARTLNWGNNLGVDTVSGIGSGGPLVVDVYGQIPPGQNAAVPGGYTDTITATVTF